MSFLNLLLLHLPVGPYSRDPDADQVRELEAIANVLEDVDGDIGDLLDEFFPGSSNVLLPDWERVFGIVPADSATTAERQQAVLAAWSKQPSLSVTYIKEVMETFTGVTVTINEEDPPLYDAATYDESTYFAWYFEVLLDQAEATAAGITLVDLQAAQRLLDRIKPAHTQGVVLVASGVYDEPASPYDWATHGA